MTGKLNDIGQRYRQAISTQRQKDYKVTPIFKGQYRRIDDRRDRRLSCRQRRRRSLQVFEVGTATMMAAKGAIKPVYQVMAEQTSRSIRRPTSPRLSAITPTSQGPPAVVPVQQLDHGVLLNKDAFKKAGLDPNQSADDLARSRRRRSQAQGVGRAALRVHDRLAIVGAARKLQRLAQRALRDRAEWLRRPGIRSFCSTDRCRSEHIAEPAADWAKKG